MLEEPDIDHRKIQICLEREYGIHASQIEFLPLGADLNTAAYLVESNGTSYFVKLRSGFFNELTVTIPEYLSKQGMQQIISPINTISGGLLANVANYKLILYPFIVGQNAYEQKLTDNQWMEFGTAIRRIHRTKLPLKLESRIPKETFSPQWREMVNRFILQSQIEIFQESVAQQCAEFVTSKKSEILDLIKRAEILANHLSNQTQDFVICHADLHAGNVLIGNDGKFYIVDWDTLTMAPKERDLMYIGGGLMNNDRGPQEEEALFYQTYHPQAINPFAIAYYRYERIIQDIAAFCEQLLLTHGGGEDREQSLFYLKSNFLPNNTIEIAYQSDKTVWS
ncbi:MAG: phosphotransferase [Anaerolineaceae bacterium]